jgi:hypothetical protein
MPREGWEQIRQRDHTFNALRGEQLKTLKKKRCTRGGYQRGKDFWGEDKSMRLSVEGNTIEKMIVDVGQERRGRYFCEREVR